MDCVRIGEEIDWSSTRSMPDNVEDKDISHSATGLVFPGTSSAPPMLTTRPIFSPNTEPVCCTACASVVRGPNAMYVMLCGSSDCSKSITTTEPGFLDKMS